MTNLEVLKKLVINLKKPSIQKNKIYELYLKNNELTQPQIDELIKSIKEQYTETNQVMATLREYKGITYEVVSDFESRLKKSNVELLRIVDFLKKAHETIIDLLYGLEETNRDELHYIEEKNMDYAFKNAMEYKKYLKAIYGLGQNIGHDHEEGIAHHTGWYSHVLKNMHKYLNALHEEYKQHSHKDVKSEKYKKLLHEFSNHYFSRSAQIINEEAKLALSEKMYEEILYLIELSKCLTRITNECAEAHFMLDGVRYRGLRGFWQEFWGS